MVILMPHEIEIEINCFLLKAETFCTNFKLIIQNTKFKRIITEKEQSTNNYIKMNLLTNKNWRSMLEKMNLENAKI